MCCSCESRVLTFSGDSTVDVGDGDMQADPRPTRARPEDLRGWVSVSMLAPDPTGDGDLRALRLSNLL